MTEPPSEFPIRADLAERRARRRWPLATAAAVAVTLLSVLGAVLVWRTYLSDLPKVPPREQLWSVNRSPGITFQDRDGRVIAIRGPRHGEKLTLRRLPPHVAHAFLAAEDHRFYEHGPVDVQGVARAISANWRAGAVVQGGSTLTQQLAKTIWLSPEQSLKRKLQEAVLAWELERILSKDEVLELYLNRIFFGANAYGLDAAAQTYFGKPATDLTLAEAALLAALPKAPSRLRPTRDMQAALQRSHLVLRRMRENGWITRTAEHAAIAAPPVLKPPGPGEGDLGYPLDLAARQAQQLAGSSAPDLVVRLTLDPALQAQASRTVRQVIASQGRRAGARQAAVVALAPDGGVRALIGGLDHDASPFDRAVQARRQPGSAFKPFIYAAALNAGVRPQDLRRDAPVRLGPWSPQNYGGGYRGMVTVEEALARSINTVSVRLAQEAKPEKVAELASRFGVGGVPTKPEMSIALGAYEVSLLDLTGGYQVFQSGGRRFPPYLIQTITAADGRLLYQRHPSAALQVYDPARARQMTRMLQAVVERGTGRRAQFGRPAAGKTGTSQNWRDAWFVGFTPDWVVGVWVGNDDNRPMNRVTGGDLPAEIWRRVMILAHGDAAVHGFALEDERVAAPLTSTLDARETDALSEGSSQSNADDAAGAFYGELGDAFDQVAE